MYRKQTSTAKRETTYRKQKACLLTKVKQVVGLNNNDQLRFPFILPFDIIEMHSHSYLPMIRRQVPCRKSALTWTVRCMSEAPPDTGGDRLTNILIRAIDSKPRPRPKLSPEEAKKNYEIGRNYVIGRFQRHNEVMHDLACKMKMKSHAIKMMPRSTDETLGYLRKEALKIDSSRSSMPPLYRPIPLDTPPVPGYDASKYILEDDVK